MSNGEFGVADVQPGAAGFGIKQPVIGRIAGPAGQGGKPQRVGRKALLRHRHRHRANRKPVHGINVDPLIVESVHEPSMPTTHGTNS